MYTGQEASCTKFSLRLQWSGFDSGCCSACASLALYLLIFFPQSKCNNVNRKANELIEQIPLEAAYSVQGHLLWFSELCVWLFWPCKGQALNFTNHIPVKWPTKDIAINMWVRPECGSFIGTFTHTSFVHPFAIPCLKLPRRRLHSRSKSFWLWVHWIFWSNCHSSQNTVDTSCAPGVFLWTFQCCIIPLNEPLVAL